VKLAFRDVQTKVTSWMGRVQRALDPPLGPDAQPLEIREAIIEAIVARSLPAGGGRRVLAHNSYSVSVLAPTPDDRTALQAVLAGLEAAVLARLREIRCQVPDGFAIDLHYIRRPRPGWTPDQCLSIDYATRDVAAAPSPSAPDIPALTITVVRGTATEPAYALTEAHVQIGRGTLPVDNGGRPRTNHVAFVEEGDEHSSSVGRAHAFIRFDSSRREYRLFDEGSRNGTRVVRKGTTIELARRDPTGVTLLSGDEIHLGTAAIRVEIG
jgi:hypothetical protein